MKHRKRKYEKIHNRSKPRLPGPVNNHSPGAQDHWQQLGKIWHSMDNQWPEAASSKPPDPWLKPQATSRKRQASQYDHIYLIGFKSVKERSKKDNRRPEQTIQDARAFIQPAGPHVHYWVNIS